MYTVHSITPVSGNFFVIIQEQCYVCMPVCRYQSTISLQFNFYARFLSLARTKLRPCSANHRPGNWSNLPVIGRAQVEYTPRKRQKTDPDFSVIQLLVMMGDDSPKPSWVPLCNIVQIIEAKTKLTPSRRRHFQGHLSASNYMNLIWNFTEVCS